VKLAIIGGCGSSGTTLLAHLLSKHSSIVSAPEMKFFNHPEALSLAELSQHQQGLFNRQRLPHGYHVVPTFLRAGREFGIDRDLFAGWIESSHELQDVYDALTRHMCEAHGASVFVEKTPSNVYNFAALAAQFPDLPLIHQIRDGRDVVASFLNRDKSLFHAASQWLYDTSCAMRVRGSAGYLETRYEDLAHEPAKALTNILAHIGLELEPEILRSEAEKTEGTYQEQWLDRKTPRAWKQLPSQPVSTRSVGRYRERLTETQLSTVYRVRLTDRTRDEIEAPVSIFGELLDLLGYGSSEDRPASASAPPRLAERSQELRDFAFRAGRTLRYDRRLPRRFTTIARVHPSGVA
jgi:hypothetical protein